MVAASKRRTTNHNIKNVLLHLVNSLYQCLELKELRNTKDHYVTKSDYPYVQCLNLNFDNICYYFIWNKIFWYNVLNYIQKLIFCNSILQGTTISKSRNIFQLPFCLLMRFAIICHKKTASRHLVWYMG